MTVEREQLIERAIERAIGSLAEDQRTMGAGGLFELTYPLVAADVPDASSEEIRAAFASVWGIEPADRGLYEQVLAVCDRHAPGEDKTIQQVLQRAAKDGDVEAALLLALVKNIR
ncbi:hypothetical protein [Microvirga pakistanensis]|uniref:hypothetical protein n=1 Tax=Microvirga pakistanensis TaxID=1682650 RepID=UPI00106C9C77|nr:hypothetical protein [Microvirga pakistanensis]